MSDIPVIYVAGPFRGPSAWAIEQNIRVAEEWSLEIWRAGGAALCPHCNTRFFQGAAPDEVWLDGDIAILEKCDAIFMVPGWTNSTGACAELAHARKCGIRKFESLSMLRQWIKDFRANRCTDAAKTDAGVY